MTAQDAANPTLVDGVTTADLDHLLTSQFALAWAGEGGEEPRLSWWRTELCCDDGGADLFQRLLPGSHEWATLQSVREAARRADTRCRGDNHDPDRLLSLFRLGFVIDERAEERIADLKRSAGSPLVALPGLKSIVSTEWSRDAFSKWVTSHGSANSVNDPAGVRLRGEPPSSLRELVDRLVAAHHPFPDTYPLPHYRRGA